MLTTVQQAFLPGALLVFHPQDKGERDIVELAPSVREQRMHNGKATTYMCENYACQEPLTDKIRLKERLSLLH